MKYNEIQKKSLDELKRLDKELREELFGLKIKNRTAQLEKKSQIAGVRKDIARVQTQLSVLKDTEQSA